MRRQVIFLGQLGWDYSPKLKKKSAYVTHVDVDRFWREIVVGKANNFQDCTVPWRCGLFGPPRRQIGDWFVYYFR
jgi:hypothetical protein